MTQTDNVYLNAVGGYIMKKSTGQSEENWEKARQKAKEEGALEEFEQKKKEWDDYMFDEMFD